MVARISLNPLTPSAGSAATCATCRDSLWQAIDTAADATATLLGQTDPAMWRTKAALSGFVPGLLPNKFTFTNRPTFQQVLEFERQ